VENYALIDPRACAFSIQNESAPLQVQIIYNPVNAF